MADRYAQLANSPLAPALRRLGLPSVPRLERGTGPLTAVRDCGVALGGEGPLRERLAGALGGLGVGVGDGELLGAALYDATALRTAADLVELQGFWTPHAGRIAASGRAVLFTLAAPACADAAQRAAQRGVEGFARSLGKELGRKGITVNVVAVSGASQEGLDGVLAFLLSGRSAYVSGQVIPLGAPVHPPQAGDPPLANKRAVVTGAARGIGAAIVAALAREGAEVVGVDLPAAGEELERTVAPFGGVAAGIDITATDAAARLVEAAEGRIDVLVHNAGITADRTLRRIDRERFAKVVAVNAEAVERIDAALLAEGRIGVGGRIVCLSSIAGIAGNAGQTNYAASKAYLIGHVESLAAELGRRGATINAVAPGFIETAMTAAMPFGVREVGRRLNSLLQGGLPADVAEAVAWLADPRTATFNGRVLRVCGQSFLGA